MSTVSETISVTLKFGFQQKRVEYTVKNVYNSIIEQLYRDAEEWLRELANGNKNGSTVGRFTIYLFRIPSTEFSMAPIILPSDIEQNSLIEIVLVPVELSPTSHSLYRCQLSVPTNCSQCSRFIPGLYKQGFRCRKCKKIYHTHCSPFQIDDCPVASVGDSTPTHKKVVPNLSTLVLMRPFVNSDAEKLAVPQSTIVPFYRISMGPLAEQVTTNLPDKIVAKGIFPACMRGANFYRRFLFCLTTDKLSTSTNLSATNVLQVRLSQITDVESSFALSDIEDLILTHMKADHDDVFEIYLRNKTVISVGKKTDSHDLQMDTAQFYSSVRDQRESLINSTTAASSTQVSGALGGPEIPPISLRHDDPKLAPEGVNKRIDLHELYSFTGEKLGEGAFGRVMGGYQKTTKRQVAIKIMEKGNCSAQDIQRINDEINKLYRFSHVNILKLEAYYERDDAVYIITERMETDMCNYITGSKNGYLDEELCKILLYQIIVALRYLHGQSCGHLDIKCDNILISRLPTNDDQEYPLVKLADFGYSRIIGEHSFRKTRVGTVVYNAPEIFNSKEGYNRLADMWSVGIVLYAALSGTLPYDEKDSQHAEQIVSDKKKLYADARWKQVSKDAIEFISNGLLVTQLKSRITPTGALLHNWFTDFTVYKNLREIERRTKSFMLSRQEEPPLPPTWLTDEREDPVWEEYKAIHAASRV